MDRLMKKMQAQGLRAARVRSRAVGTTERPRLSVNVSNRHITAQIIDDSKHKTLAYLSTVGQKKVTGTLTEQAEWVGTEIAKLAKSAKVKKVVFDRGSRLYHGRVAALADAARKAGLEI